jgi:hypothetical protein
MEKNRLKIMEAKIVEDVMVSEIKFKEALSKVIEDYNIKIDVAKMEAERDKHKKIPPQEAEKRRNARALKRILREHEEEESKRLEEIAEKRREIEEWRKAQADHA